MPIGEFCLFTCGREGQTRVSQEISPKACFLDLGPFMILNLPITKASQLLLSPQKCHTSPFTCERCLLRAPPTPPTVISVMPCVQESGEPHTVCQASPLCRRGLRSWALLRMHGSTALRSYSRSVKERRQSKRDKEEEACPCHSWGFRGGEGEHT